MNISVVKCIFEKRERRNLYLLFFLLCIGGFLELLGVALFLPLIEVISAPGKIQDSRFLSMIYNFLGVTSINSFIIFVCGGMIIVYLLKNIYLAYMNRMQFKFVYHFQSDLRCKLLERYLRKPYVFHSQKNIAEINRSLTNDVYNLGDYIMAFLQLLSEGIVCVCLITYLLITDVMTTLLILGLLSVFSVIYFIPVKKRLNLCGEKNQLAYSEFVKSMNQAWGSIKETKIFQKEAFFIQQFRNASEDYADYKIEFQFLSVIPRFLLETITMFGIIMAIIIKIVSGESSAELFAELSVIAVAAYRLLPSVNRINTFYGQMSYTKPSVDLVINDLKEVNEKAYLKKVDNKKQFEACKGYIQINNLNYRYPGGERMILDNVNMKIKLGTSVGIVGETGSGKTTLVDVLLGLLEPDTGNIICNDIDIWEQKSAWLKEIGYIPQNIYIMDDSIRNNVAFGIPKEDIDDEYVWRALKEANLDKFVKQLPDGLDNVVGERGAKLSGGQCQRIGIARALYHNPSIIVLDEATSSLDTNTEEAVMNSIESLHGKVTLIIIAHRLSTIEKCDEVYEVMEGKVKKLR